MAEMLIEKEGRKTGNELDEELASIIQKQATRIKVVGCGGGGGNSVSE